MRAAREQESLRMRESTYGDQYFWAEVLQTRTEWNDIFKAAKENNCQLRILYPKKLSSGKEIKTFPDKETLRKLITTRSVLQEMVKGVP